VTQLPRIHLNGTSGHVLAEEYGTALTMLDQAIEALSAVTVHGRDYYPISPRAAMVAMDEHMARLKKLRQVQAELALIYGHIFRQLSEREEPEQTYTGITG